jgi:hypothetical protein
MNVSYCRRWNFKRSRPIDPLTVDQARERDQAGELYTVVIGDPTAPDRVIEVVRPNHVGTWFFDRHQRQSLNYLFRRVDDTTMFLHNITRWAYPNDQARTLNESNLIETIDYEPDGIAHHTVRDEAAGEDKRTSYRAVKLDINTEPVPTFGDWQSIARYDRVDPDEPVDFSTPTQPPGLPIAGSPHQE